MLKGVVEGVLQQIYGQYLKERDADRMLGIVCGSTFRDNLLGIGYWGFNTSKDYGLGR